MAKILADLLATVEALRAEVSSLKTSPRRATSAKAGTRRVIGKYERHPLGSMAFQNDALDWNAATGHLTDNQLCLWWNAEYEDVGTRALTVPMVGFVRAVHNQGVHGKSDVAPTVPVPEFK